MTSRHKSVVLLSAGLDSTVNFYLAKEKTEVRIALTFDYGQRAAKKEIQCAQRISKKLKVKHQVVLLPFFKDFGNSSLINKKFQVPTQNKVQIDNLKVSQASAKSVWVPNRNGIFLNVAAGFAEALGADVIIPGFNIEEAATFPDNTQEYLDAVTKSFSFSTANHVRAICYTAGMDKAQIVAEGKKQKIDWKQIWPCYLSKEKWCGECESCQRARRALQKNDINVEGLF